ncbi:MAG: cupin domain-containing protein [Chromatiales bacterium]|nr:cupin domain-containing protein [Chromatiales bacterium]
MSEQDFRLIEYVMGSLDESQSGQLRQDLAGNAALQAKLRALQETLARLDEEAPPMEPDTQLKARLLRSVEPEGQPLGQEQRLSALFDLGVSRIRELLAAIAELPGGSWRASGIPGVLLLHFPGGPRLATADCGLVHIEAGAVFPRHRHRDIEMALLLQGELEDGQGRVYRPGDPSLQQPGSEHQLRVLGDQAAVLAVVSYTKPQFLR